MANPRQIMCIDRTDRDAAHERISHVGGLNTDGTIWKITQSDAIAGAEAGEWQFYASVWGRPVWIVVATTADGEKYLKTETDAAQPNGLLTVPQCP